MGKEEVNSRNLKTIVDLDVKKKKKICTSQGKLKWLYNWDACNRQRRIIVEEYQVKKCWTLDRDKWRI